MALRRPNLLVAFGLMSAVPVVLLAVALSVYLEGIIRDRNLSSARDTATFVASIGLPAYVPEEEVENGLSERTRRLLDAVLGSGLVGDQLTALEIVNREGRTVFSTGPTGGARLASEEDVARALRGRQASGLSTVDGKEVLLVSVPVVYFPTLRPAGVASFALPYDMIATAVAKDMRRLYLVLLGGLALFYVLLFPIVARVSNTLRRQAAENERLALHDALTGLPNRNLFAERLEAALQKLSPDGPSVVVMVIDVDRFKEVNDRLGHHNGDELLRIVGGRLRDAVRDVDTVARLGGDEFGIVMPRLLSSFAAEIARRVQDALEQPVSLGGTLVEPRMSTGVAFAPEHGCEFEPLIHEADLAMYAAKEAGGSGFRIAARRQTRDDAPGAGPLRATPQPAGP